MGSWCRPAAWRIGVDCYSIKDCAGRQFCTPLRIRLEPRLGKSEMGKRGKGSTFEFRVSNFQFPFPSLHPITQSPDHSMTRFSFSPFSVFPFCLFSRFALSPLPLLTGLSAARPPPPRLPSRGRPPPPSDCTPWPLGRRGRSSCRGTLRSNARPSTAGHQELGSGLGARDSGCWVLQFW